MKNGRCEWTEDSDGTWNTDCGHSYVINEGTPEENEMKYCAFCGWELIQNEYALGDTNTNTQEN